MSMKTATTTTDATAKDRRRVQWLEDDDGGESRSIMVLVDWQRQRSVAFPRFQVANSDVVSSLSSCCIVLIFFHHITFPRSLHEIISVLQ